MSVQVEKPSISGCEAVMIGDTAYDAKAVPGEVQRRREFCPASFKKDERGCSAVADEVSRCSASLDNEAAPGGEL